MIIKYLDGNGWTFIGNVMEPTAKQLDGDALIMEYDKAVEEKQRMDEAGLYPHTTIEAENASKIFIMVAQDTGNLSGPLIQRNLLHNFHKRGTTNAQSAVYLIRFMAPSSYGNSVYLIVTDDPVYLLNDEGKTIERLS